jgi:hypothetical protein
MDPNHDIVPTLRMMDGLLMTKAADEIERLRHTAIGRTEGFDRAIRRMRRRYFDNNPSNTWLAVAFNELLRLNGTYEEDTEANARREAAANGA